MIEELVDFKLTSRIVAICTIEKTKIDNKWNTTSWKTTKKSNICIIRLLEYNGKGLRENYIYLPIYLSRERERHMYTHICIDTYTHTHIYMYV